MRLKIMEVLAVAGLISTAGFSSPAQAGTSLHIGWDWPSNHHVQRRQGHHWKKQHHYGHKFNRLPHGFIKVKVGQANFYYHRGRYFRKHGHHYIHTAAPYGACLARLPAGYRRFHVHGESYYVYDDVYYERTREGYVVVPDPYDRAEIAFEDDYPQRRTGTNRRGAEEEISINIPNKSGGYTSVTIKRTANGYIGPEGELYNDFPKIAHLKEIYGL